MQKSFKVILGKDEDGVYTVRAPELPGCVSDGKTKAKALKNIKEAITAYLETMKEEGWSLPSTVHKNTF